MQPIVWMECDLCEKLMPFKRYLIKPGLTYLECMGCGNNLPEQQEDVA
jgi:hypothetical protein